jgi:SNF2 family DNA or RNA helicase
MINGWILGGTLFAVAITIKLIKVTIENKKDKVRWEKWLYYSKCIKNHEKIKDLNLQLFFYSGYYKDSATYSKAICDNFDFTTFDSELFLKDFKQYQEWNDSKIKQALEEIDWQEQNIHIFKNTHIVMDLNNVQSIEKCKARYVVYMNNGRTRWLNFNEGSGIMEQFVKYKTKNNLI